MPFFLEEEEYDRWQEQETARKEREANQPAWVNRYPTPAPEPSLPTWDQAWQQMQQVDMSQYAQPSAFQQRLAQAQADQGPLIGPTIPPLRPAPAEAAQRAWRDAQEQIELPHEAVARAYETEEERYRKMGQRSPIDRALVSDPFTEAWRMAITNKFQPPAMPETPRPWEAARREYAQKWEEMPEAFPGAKTAMDLANPVNWILGERALAETLPGGIARLGAGVAKRAAPIARAAAESMGPDVLRGLERAGAIRPFLSFEHEARFNKLLQKHTANAERMNALGEIIAKEEFGKALGKGRGAIVRPPWAAGWTEHALAELAEQERIPYTRLMEEDWWVDMDPVAISDKRPYRYGESAKKVKSERVAGGVSDVEREYAALAAEQQKLEAQMTPLIEETEPPPMTFKEQVAPKAKPTQKQGQLFKPGEAPIEFPQKGKPAGTADILSTPQFPDEAARLRWEREQQIAAGQGEMFGAAPPPPTSPTAAPAPGGATPPDKLQEILRRQAGTPEQAAELRPPLPEHAGNVRLEKLPPESAPAVQQAFEETNQFAGQRRGVIPDAEVRARAEELSKTRTIEDWLKIKPGKALNAEENVALRNVVVRTEQEARTLAERVTQATASGEVTPRMQFEQMQKFAELKALLGVSSGGGAEAGRSLRSFQQVFDGAVESKGSWDKALDFAYKKMGGDEEAFNTWLSRWLSLDPTDVVGRHKALQMLGNPSKMNKVIAWTVSNMVSAPRSILVDAFSNTVNSVERPLLTLLGGDPRAALDDVVYMGRAFGAAWADAATMFKEGVSPMEARGAARVAKYDVQPDAFPGKQGLLYTPALRTKSAIDEFAQNVNAAGAMASRARIESRTSGKTFADLMKTPSETMLTYAEKAGRDAVFKASATFAGDALIGLRSRIYKPGFQNRATGLAAHVLVPFIRVPEAIYGKGIKKTIDPLLGLGVAARGVRQGNKEMVREGMSRTVLASTALAGFYALAAQGALTGNGPQNVDKRRMLEEARDEKGNPIWQAHSVKIGDRWYDYTNLGPWAIPMGVMGSAVESYRMEGKKVDPDYAGRVFGDTAKIMADASYIRAIGTMFRAVLTGNAEQFFGNQMPADVLSRFIPYGGAVTQLERSTDYEARDPRNPLENFMARVPGLAEDVQTRLGPLGTPIQKPQDLPATFSPVRTSSAGQPAPVAAEMARLGMSVGAPDKIVKVGDKDVVLSPEQQRTLQQRQGQAIETAVGSLMEKDYYQKTPSDDVKKALASAVANKMRSIVLADTKNATQGKASMWTDQMLQEAAAEYPLAYGEWLQYNGMPSRLGMTKQQEVALQEAKRYYDLKKQDFKGNAARAYAAVENRYGQDTRKQLYQMNNRPSDPRRKRFYDEHPLLQKWFRGSAGLEIAVENAG